MRCRSWLGWSPADLETLIGKADDPADPGLLERAASRTDYRDRSARPAQPRGRSCSSAWGRPRRRPAQWCERAGDRRRREGDPRRRQVESTTTRPGRRSLTRCRTRCATCSARRSSPTSRRARQRGPRASTTADADDLYAHFLIDVADERVPADVAHQAGDRLGAALCPALPDGTRARRPDRAIRSGQHWDAG